MGYPIDTDDVRLIDKKRLSVGVSPLTISSTALQAFSAAAISGLLSSVTEATDMSRHEFNLFIARSISPPTISSTALQAFSAASSGSLSSVTEATDMSRHELNLFIARSISPLTISSTALQAFSAAASSGSRSSVLNLDSTHAARS